MNLEMDFVYKFFVLLVVILLLHCISACRKNESILLKNESIECSFEKSQLKRHKMCLVLIDKNDTISKIYLTRLESTYRKFPQIAIFNVVDVTDPKNRWYKEWINSYSFPITCVFSEEEKLIAIIGGASAYSFNGIKMTLNNKFSGGEFGYKSTLYNINFAIAFLDDVLKCKLNMDKNKNCDKDIEKTLNQLQYPFNVYLKYRNELNQNKMDEATCTANQLLMFQDSLQFAKIYADMFKDVKEFLNPHESTSNDPILTIKSGDIILHNCTLDNVFQFQITVKNTGRSILQIKNIDVGCSCIKLLNDRITNINPDKEHTFKFTYTPDSKGENRRTITFISNATNSIVEVEVVAFVN